MTTVFLHGFTGDPTSWDEVRGRVGGLALPLAGHAPGLLAPTRWDAEIARLARAVAPRAPVRLVGYSMGARVALGLVAARPDLVERAILVGVHPGLADPARRAARAAEDAAWMRLLDGGIAPFVSAWEARPIFASQSPELRARERARRLRHDPRGLQIALAALGLAAMPPHSLAAMSRPLLVVAGAADEKFHALANGARLRLVEDAGHNVVLERPAALAALIEEEFA
jgi:2-succinyl-6-hydroxy-2,4-cyclohexadiene-1-carboxylate synthase